MLLLAVRCIRWCTAQFLHDGNRRCSGRQWWFGGCTVYRLLNHHGGQRRTWHSHLSLTFKTSVRWSFLHRWSYFLFSIPYIIFNGLNS